MAEKEFSISIIGDTKRRVTLGPLTSVEMFRIIRTSLVNIISLQLGEEKGDEACYLSGKAVGGEIGRAFLAEVKDLDDFVGKVRQLLINLKVGVLSVVSADVDTGKFVIVVEECVSCSGTPNIGKSICYFEGGIIAGVMKHYLKKEVKAVETKCWGLGDKICEFDVTVG